MRDDQMFRDELVETHLRQAFAAADLPEPPDRLRDQLELLPGRERQSPRSPRRAVWLLPAVAAIVVAGGLAALAGASWISRKPLPSTPGPTAVVTPYVVEESASPSGLAFDVPWSSERPAAPTSTPTPTLPAAPPCTADQLAIGNADWQGATGSMAGGFSVWNRSGVPCIVGGVPRVDIIDASSARLAVTKQTMPDEPLAAVFLTPNQPAPQLHAEVPRGLAVVPIWWSNWCGGSPSQPLRLRVALPEGTPLGETRVQSANVPRCDDPNSASGLSIGPFEASVGSEPTAPPAIPAESLSLALEVPVEATIGEPLRYVAVLSNPSSAPIGLTPCPAYMERLNEPGETAGDLFVLNCSSVGAIGPGQSVRFEMMIDVPARFIPTDQAALVWSLDPFGVEGLPIRPPTAKVAIRVVAP